jgi:predicted Ser/Thr protein kinase
MDSVRWERIQTLFHEAAERPADERVAFLAKACGGDDLLAAEVLAMLDEDARGASLLDHEVGEIAGRIAGGEDVPAALRQIGAYRVLKVLGEGGMGVVYLAQREDLGSLAAIKILRDAWMSPARRARFESERRTLAQLNHPSIARLYDADTLRDGTPFFVMEYVEGVPLTEYCRAQGCGVREKLRLFRAVCEAVHYAHRHAIIHRDLKPSNILVKPDGSVRLLDFGIAKQMDPAGGPMNVEHTRSGLRMMTPAYAAPEQIRGQSVGIHTDVYSLGVILYELLAGRLPFDPAELTAGEMETLIVEGAAQQPSAGADLDVLCLTAMHRDAERRYGSVEALIRDVDHYLEGEPLDSRPDTVGYRLGKFVGRNRRAVMAAAAVLVLVAALVIVFTVRLAGARNAALAQTARTQRIQRFMLNLFDGGDKAAGPAQDLRVVTLIDHGVQEARSLNAEPAVQADLYETLGGVSHFEQAGESVGELVEERAQGFGVDL